MLPVPTCFTHTSYLPSMRTVRAPPVRTPSAREERTAPVAHRCGAVVPSARPVELRATAAAPPANRRSRLDRSVMRPPSVCLPHCNWHAVSRHAGDLTVDAVGAPAEQSDALAALVGNSDFINTVAPGAPQLRRNRRQLVARQRARQEVYRSGCGYRVVVVGIARKRERAVRQGEYQSAMAHGMTVHHVGAHPHHHARIARTHLDKSHAEGLRGLIALKQHLRGPLREQLRLRWWLVHCSSAAHISLSRSAVQMRGSRCPVASS